MPGQELTGKLRELLDLILEERKCATTFDLDRLQDVVREKEALVRGLEPADDPGPEQRALAEEIKKENRRNAYLFWTSLNFIRNSMSFFTRQVSQPSAYGAGGTMVDGNSSGLFLAGRV